MLANCAGIDNRQSSETVATVEQHRPLLHFTPASGWMNDPNGLVYLDGEYHLFFQYYPDSTVWGPMHWGHAVSTDLINWQELPIALYPDSLGYIFSGSAVVDHRNSSGLGNGSVPPLVAVFTHHDMQRQEAGDRQDYEYQSLAYSLDRGRSWTKYAGNPVLPNLQRQSDFRDPKVTWDERGRQWVMVLAAGDHVEFYGSSDLLSWSPLSSFGSDVGGHGGVWECPDLVLLRDPVTGEDRHVLIVSINPGGPNGGSATQYFVGDFDGQAFTVDPAFAARLRRDTAVWIDYGRDNYAGVTYSNAPDGRTIFQGWMSNWQYAQVVPTERWRSAMTLPRELRLTTTDAGPLVQSVLIPELRTTEVVSPAYTALGLPVVLELDVPLDGMAEGQEIGLALYNGVGEELRLGLEGSRERYYVDRTRAGKHDFSDAFAPGVSYGLRHSDSDTLRLQVVVDVGSVECFADDGQTVMTALYFATEPLDRVRAIGVADERIEVRRVVQRDHDE